MSHEESRWSSEVIIKSKKKPDYSELANIRSADNSKRMNRLIKLYPSKYLTTPWRYLVRSRIRKAIRKGESSNQ